MANNLDFVASQFHSPDISLPPTWFESRITLEQIRKSFLTSQKEIRIASGFFTIKGWGLIRRHTEGKRVYLLVGIDEPGEERAKMALVQEIMRHLATGIDFGRRQSVSDLIIRMEQRDLSIVDARASAHHGKLYIVDRHTAINASANTTGHGFLDQIESGGLYAPSVIERFVSDYENKHGVQMDSVIIEALHHFVESQVANFIQKFDQYFATAADITQSLLEALKRWQRLVEPWDIYLKTILALEQLKPIQTSYSKQPVPYQRDMIAQSLRQIRQHGGSMLVASTGLGKTVMGTLIAMQLRAEDLIDKVIIICPLPVRRAWQREMRDASIYADYFTLQTLDREDEQHASDLENWEEIVDDVCQGRGRYLLILDESHQLRKRYPDEFSNRRYRQEDKKERKAFTRINQLVNQLGNLERVKVLLLSGSPYATHVDNLNTQLYLLPHTSDIPVLLPELEGALAWKITDTNKFLNLPVTHQLTAPHVAKYYTDQDTQGCYLKFGDQKKYFPNNVVLHSLYFFLPFENELGAILSSGYFDLNTKHPIYRQNIATQIKVAWGSSPRELKEMLERVCDTPGGANEFDFAKKEKSAFIFDREQRQAVLNPLIQQLRELTFEQDDKLGSLLLILGNHCPQEKVIIFCERHATAYYLEQALTQLTPSLRVFCTIVQHCSQKNQRVLVKYKTKKLKDIQKAIAKFAPVANNAVDKYQETYEVFITTDAFGIGIDMQDASVVINYDMAWTAIEPNQRAGRILRPWQLPRTVQLYTFIPTVEEQTELRWELLNISQRWQNLMQRHAESRKLTDLPVLTTNAQQEIDMPEFASNTRVTIESGKLVWERTDDEGVSSYYQHTQKLHSHREYAQNLDSDLVSALTYSGESVLLYLLLKHQEEYYILLYDPEKEEIRSPKPEYLLSLIACTRETEVAMVDVEQVEALSNAGIRAWCQQQSFPEEEVIRECTLYLKPESAGDEFKDWLKVQQM
jgi:superfamily II DNA or RNA helicase